MLSPITLKFLEAVKLNNNVKRMHANRDLYVQERDRYADLIASLLEQMKKLNDNLSDITTKDCIYRFNKDIRFSKDKSPYKTHFGAFISPGGRKSPIPGYYLHIQPGNESWISGGSRCPSPTQRDNIILHIWKHRDRRQEIMNNTPFKNYFGELTDKDEVSLERRLKTSKTKKLIEQFLAVGTGLAPVQGRAEERFDILLYPHFCVRHNLKDEETLQTDFEQTVMKGFKLLKPFNDFLSEALY